MIIVKCLYCGKEFQVIDSRKNKAKYCSYLCYWKNQKGKHHSPKTELKKGHKTWNKGLKFPERTGKNSPSWKNGTHKRNGYVYIYAPNHPNTTKLGYILRSHLVAEKCLGRLLTEQEMVHHIGERTNDRPEMLYLFPSRDGHNKHHFKKNQPELKSNLIPSL